MRATNPSSTKFRPRSQSKDRTRHTPPRSLQHALADLQTPPATFRQLHQLAKDKGWPLWSVYTKPSVVEKALLLIAALGAVTAWWLCELPASLTIIGTVIILVGTVAGLHHNSQPGCLSFGADDLWHWSTPSGSTSGALASGCYISRYVLVLLLRSDTGGKTRITIWRDSVSNADFSCLTMRLYLTPRAGLRS